ncbi:MAG TPA: helix-turn-helix domain-containing protein [Candidatus Tumulicola sp.]|nr:helix-turn-helix domain-containing protein [Candidatus Tumulicola sp.]
MSSKKMTAKKGGHAMGGFCPRYHQAVELVGRRWTGAIIRLLLGGPRRFNEIVSGVPGLSDRLLAERLRELEEAGIIIRVVAGGRPVRVDYVLTESGAELESTVRALAEWAERWIKPPTAAATG